MADSKILSKIRKLLRLAKGNANLNEAAAALARAHALMEAHRITEAQANFDVEEVTMEVVWKGSSAAYWRQQLIQTVAEHNGCTAVLQKRYRFMAIGLVGRPKDIEVARYMVRYLVSEVNRICAACWAVRKERAEPAPHTGFARSVWLRPQGRTAPKAKLDQRKWRNSFRLGAVMQIDQRLQEARAEARRRAQATAAPAGTTALAIAKVDGRVALAKQWLNEAGVGPPDDPKLKLDNEALHIGIWAAGNIGLTPPAQQMGE